MITCSRPSTAAQRQDGAVELGPKLKGGAGLKVIGKLLREQLVEEIPGTHRLPVDRLLDRPEGRAPADDGELARRLAQRHLLRRHGGIARSGVPVPVGSGRASITRSPPKPLLFLMPTGIIP